MTVIRGYSSLFNQSAISPNPQSAAGAALNYRGRKAVGLNSERRRCRIFLMPWRNIGPACLGFRDCHLPRPYGRGYLMPRLRRSTLRGVFALMIQGVVFIHLN